jgi:Mg-chelatase subunit ChlD
VVSFNSAFKLEHSLLKMSNSNKQAAKGIQQNLRAGGGTSIFNGMNEGARILRQRRTFNGASCMFLLTDGQDSSDKERKEALATEMRNAGTALFVFGFGADHDAKEMSSLAESAEGSFIYVETDDAVVDAFGGAIGSMQGNSLATKLTLRVQAATPGVLIDSVRGGRYAFSINAEKDLAKVSIANMFHWSTL